MGDLNSEISVTMSQRNLFFLHSHLTSQIEYRRIKLKVRADIRCVEDKLDLEAMENVQKRLQYAILQIK